MIVVYQPLCRDFRKIQRIAHSGLLVPVTIKYLKKEFEFFNFKTTDLIIYFDIFYGIIFFLISLKMTNFFYPVCSTVFLLLFMMDGVLN